MTGHWDLNEIMGRLFFQERRTGGIPASLELKSRRADNYSKQDIFNEYIIADSKYPIYKKGYKIGALREKPIK